MNPPPVAPAPTRSPDSQVRGGGVRAQPADEGLRLRQVGGRDGAGGRRRAPQGAAAPAEDALDEDALHRRLADQVLPQAAHRRDAVAAVPVRRRRRRKMMMMMRRRRRRRRRKIVMRRRRRMKIMMMRKMKTIMKMRRRR